MTCAEGVSPNGHRTLAELDPDNLVRLILKFAASCLRARKYSLTSGKVTLGTSRMSVE